MNEYFELGLKSYQEFPTGDVVIVFSDNLCFHYSDKQLLSSNCDSEIVNYLRKCIISYCLNLGESVLEDKKLVFDLNEPNGNILRII